MTSDSNDQLERRVRKLRVKQLQHQIWEHRIRITLVIVTLWGMFRVVGL